MNYTKEDFEAAHKFSANNKPALKNDKICGCFDCLAIFSPQEITSYLQGSGFDRYGTALCPYCYVDSVIGESSGFPITKEFLHGMKRRWFGTKREKLLSTPFGDVKLLFDGMEQDLEYFRIDPGNTSFPDVDEAYRIFFDFEPDRKEHRLTCVLTGCSTPGKPDSGKELETVSFYIGEGKITLGCCASFDDHDADGFDFGGSLLADGMELILKPETQAQTLRFGVSWVSECTPVSDVQTWLGADPSL